jgi:hypothetical protein
MARWRAEALQRLPELRTQIDSAPGIMAFWGEAWFAFRRAYEQNPRNESLIERTYAFADWCANARRGPDAGKDPSTAIVVSFYEDIPTVPAARDDMPRWFTYAEVADSKAVFSYHLNDEEFGHLLRHMHRNRHLYRPRVPPSGEP